MPRGAIPTASEREVVGFFREAAARLAAIIQGANPNQPFVVYRRRQFGAIADVIKRLDGQSKDWVAEQFPALIQDAADGVKEEIARQGEDDFRFRFAGVPEEAVQVLTHQAYLDFGSTVRGLQASGQRAAINKVLIQKNIVQGLIQGASAGRTAAETTKALKEGGLNAVQYSNGRQVPVESYVSMLVRTQTMLAFNTAAQQQMLQAGRLFAIFPTIDPLNREPDDPCWEWEKKKYVNLLTDPVPPASTHPHCRHKLIPAPLETLKAERPDLYAKALEYYQKARDA